MKDELGKRREQEGWLEITQEDYEKMTAKKRTKLTGSGLDERSNFLLMTLALTMDSFIWKWTNQWWCWWFLSSTHHNHVLVVAPTKDHLEPTDRRMDGWMDGRNDWSPLFLSLTAPILSPNYRPFKSSLFLRSLWWWWSIEYRPSLDPTWRPVTPHSSLLSEPQ